jgi:serine/threonine protein kinase
MTPHRTTNMLEPGTMVGDRYRLEERIASGGMATVWLARDAELDRPVAVKVLSDVLADDPSYLERFRREARVAAGLSHPNLVRMFDFSSEVERPYLVMEHIEGGTLADRIASGKASEIDPRRLAEELLGALASIHAVGVVHRDVKPSNVLVDRDGMTRLTDFGIAQPEDATRITRTDQVIGTLKYMAPEVREGRPATTRSDLYACGVLLGECLEASLAPEVAALVERLTAEDPGERPASAGDALALLETAPVETVRTAGKLPPTTPLSREIEINGRRVLAIVAALALGAIVLAIALAGGGSDQGAARHSRGSQTHARTTTATSTTTAVSTTTSVAPAAPSPGAKPEKPPKPEKAPPGQVKK